MGVGDVGSDSVSQTAGRQIKGIEMDGKRTNMSHVSFMSAVVVAMSSNDGAQQRKID